MRLTAFLSFTAVSLLLAPGSAAAQFALRPFPAYQRYSYGPHVIRPDHRTQAQMNQDVREAYRRWKTRYLVNLSSGNGPLYRVVANYGSFLNTVSESQGYGMVIVSLMAGDEEPQANWILQGLWRYARTYPSGVDSRLMTWNVTSGGVVQQGNHSLFAGDSDLALGLLMAHEQYGADIPDEYLPPARALIAAQATAAMGPESALPLLGDWVDPDGATYNQHTVRTSDFMPGHFVNFTGYGGQAIWSRALLQVREQIEHLQTDYAPSTHLLPDFAVREGAPSGRLRPAMPNFRESAHDGEFFYNAARVPWRIGVHSILYRDAATTHQARRIALWSETATGGNPANLAVGYRLDGTPLNPAGFSSVFPASIAVATMVSPSQQTWLNALYDTLRNHEQGYYDDDSVTLLALLLMSGNYWEPAQLDRLFVASHERLSP